MDDSGGAFPDLNSEAHVLDVPNLAVFESLHWVKHRADGLSVTDAEAVQLIESHLLQPIEASALIDAFLHRKNSLEKKGLPFPVFLQKFADR